MQLNRSWDQSLVGTRRVQQSLAKREGASDQSLAPSASWELTATGPVQLCCIRGSGARRASREGREQYASGHRTSKVQRLTHLSPFNSNILQKAGSIRELEGFKYKNNVQRTTGGPRRPEVYSLYLYV